MAAVINTNIASLNSQRNLNTSQAALTTSLQRLSSGLRINSAKDDAAGLAISERFTSQIRGLTQAARNANDGISLAQTAESALGQIGDSLQRIRELSVQSANATNSSSDRAALQQEVSQLVSEISRIGDTTSFNGLKILDGSYTNQQYQVGANAGETIAVSVADSRSSQLGATTVSSSTGVKTGAALDAAITAGGLVVNGSAVDTTKGKNVADVINAINAQSGTSGVTATRSTSNTMTSSGIYLTGTATSLEVNGTAVSLLAADTALTAIGKINAVSTQTGITASNDGTATGALTFTSANGADFTLKSSVAATIPGVGTTADKYTAGITLSAKLGTAIDVTGALAATTLLAIPTVNVANQKNYQVSSMDISTVDGANKALVAADAALAQINGTRAQLGAVQNRFSAVVSSLSAASENFAASRSRILDTDFAAETANLTRGQILQQAGTAMLAQANSLPNGVLALLRG